VAACGLGGVIRRFYFFLKCIGATSRLSIPINPYTVSLPRISLFQILTNGQMLPLIINTLAICRTFAIIDR